MSTTNESPTPAPDPIAALPAGDLAHLGPLIEAALAESLRSGKAIEGPTAAFTFAHDRCWALTDGESIRYLLTDRAVGVLGNARPLGVVVDASGVTIRATDATHEGQAAAPVAVPTAPA